MYLELPLMTENIETQIVAAVDDDFRVRESLASLVESAGYEPAVFSSAEEFLQSGTLTAATCVITDVRMPGMDGIELQRRIRLERPTYRSFLYLPTTVVTRFDRKPSTVAPLIFCINHSMPRTCSN